MTTWQSTPTGIMRRDAQGRAWEVKHDGVAWIVVCDLEPQKGRHSSQRVAKQWAEMRITEGSFGV